MRLNNSLEKKVTDSKSHKDSARSRRWRLFCKRKIPEVNRFQINMQQGAVMNTENKMNKDGYSDSSSKTKPEKNKYSDQKKSDSRTESDHKNSETRRAGSDKYNQSEEKDRSDRVSDYQKTEPMKEPKQFLNRDDKSYSDKSDRV